MKKSYTYEELTASVESMIRLRMSRYDETGEKCYRDYAHGVFCLWDVFFGGDALVEDRDRLSALIDASFRSLCVRSGAPVECRDEAKSGRGFELLEMVVDDNRLEALADPERVKRLAA